MKAAVYTKYGSPEVVKIQEAPQPKIQSDEVLVRVHAATVSSGDVRLRGLIFPPGLGLMGRLASGIWRPRKQILGVDFAGEVRQIGAEVTDFAVGDKVFGMDGSGMGSHAEYKKIKQKAAITKMPANLEFTEAAAIPFGGTTALHFLTHVTQVKSHDKVLINGASGAVGTAALQIAKHYDAQVTGVCSSNNSELVKSLGADKVINYKQENIAEHAEQYDVIMDTVGNLKFSEVKHLLKINGRLILVSTGISGMLTAAREKQVIAGVAQERKQEMQLLTQLVEEREFRPVVDKTYKLQLEEIVKAHSYVQTRRKQGNVVIQI